MVASAMGGSIRTDDAKDARDATRLEHVASSRP